MLMSRKRIPDAIPLRPNLFGYGHSTLATEWWRVLFFEHDAKPLLAYTERLISYATQHQTTREEATQRTFDLRRCYPCLGDEPKIKASDERWEVEFKDAVGRSATLMIKRNSGEMWAQNASHR